MRVVPISLSFVKSFLVIGDTGELLLVDAGNPGDDKKIIKKIEDLDYDPTRVSVIVLTHGHRDHVGGLPGLANATGAKVLIHTGDADAIKNRVTPPTDPVGIKGRLLSKFADKQDPIPDTVEPDLEVEEGVNLHCFGIDGEVISTPGHTYGSLSVILDDGSAIVGDLVMGRFLAIGRVSYPVLAANLSEVKLRINKVLSCNPTKIYSSHSGPFEPDDLERLT